ncbi:TlpA family protein disulfide reductase [Paenibacillus mendelii]|uniref:TlpA family protein disulfide reductase n=1 Tax=Paenibacillus mendelii TaxID=206163 RepID=A0ABV6JDJ0_9BACL|nr:TlpA disulfide reductase family protein [Paenibacillus mendelii]MCQ6560931.1 TlpA family protein disulfide reductase [Paenibacillus mendelii]
MKRTLVLLAVILVLALAAVYQNKGKTEEAVTASAETKPKPGFAAPTLDLPDLNDQVVAVAGKRDQLLLVNFWASWCGPCELEAPDLQELSEEYKGDMVLYGINATSYDKERQAREFVEEYKFTFPILMDREGKAADLYKITTFPTSLIIDNEGIVRERVTGVISKQEWQSKIEKWINVQKKSQIEESEAS